MRNIGFFVFFLFGASSIFAQTTFDVGLSLYPNMSNRRLIAFNNLSTQAQKTLDSLESARPSYSIGVVAGWRGGKAGFQFGLSYMNTGYRTLKQAIPADDPQSEIASNRRYTFQNTNIEIPINLLFYQELSEKDEFFFMMGTALSFNLQNKNQVILYSGENKIREEVPVNQDDFRLFNYAFEAGMGWERTFNDRLAMIIQPNFQFWFKGVLEKNELNRSLYNFGLRIIVKRKSLPLGG